MGKFWAELTNGYESEKINSSSDLFGIKDISPSFKLFGEVEDSTELIKFVELNNVSVLNCTIVNSVIDDFIIEKRPGLNGLKNNITFKNCRIRTLIINGLKVPSFSFINCKIEKIQIKNCENIHEVKVLDKSEIIDFYLTNKSLIENLEINNSIIQNDFIAEHSAINNFKADNSSFINNISWSDNRQLYSFKLNDFRFKRISLKNIKLTTFSLSDTFGEELLIKECNFDTVEFCLKNVGFNLSLKEANFSNKIQFVFETLNSTNLLFDYCFFSNEVAFSGNVSLSSPKISLINNVFRELVLFNNNYAKCLKIKESLFLKGILLPVNNIENHTAVHSSVWCILKNQSIIRNDNLSALDYKKYELNSYSKELKGNKVKFQERLVLFFNKISNNHGLSWGRGFLFTIITWLLFYSIFALSCEGFNICFSNENCNFLFFNKSFWTDAVSYLWIPNGLSELTIGMKNNLNWFSLSIMIISYILGKIFIAYGIFQTISAFRRHGKI